MRIDLSEFEPQELAQCRVSIDYDECGLPSWVVCVCEGLVTLTESRIIYSFDDAWAVAQQAKAEIELARVSQPQL